MLIHRRTEAETRFERVSNVSETIIPLMHGGRTAQWQNSASATQLVVKCVAERISIEIMEKRKPSTQLSIKKFFKKSRTETDSTIERYVYHL